MAAKKPAKTNFSNQKAKEPELKGKAVMYQSPVRTDNLFVCPTCNRSLSKGIVYEHSNKMFCRRSCIPKETV